MGDRGVSLRREFLVRFARYGVALFSLPFAAQFQRLFGQTTEAKPTSKPCSVENGIGSRVKRVIVEQLGVDEGEVTPCASFVDDFGADSLDMVELVMAFEEAFDIEISDEDAEKICTVKDAIDYIASHVKNAQAESPCPPMDHPCPAKAKPAAPAKAKPVPTKPVTPK